ncbi:hypothetical protein [Paenarthrobacter sp.]|uniref:hypothetical protein n=1 Tax=Paenarthrobacter sp. TaxID=1931993 RepID=UPI0028120522|nr:hypothetical protein [Paenarthrobacter sp.]
MSNEHNEDQPDHIPHEQRHKNDHNQDVGDNGTTTGKPGGDEVDAADIAAIQDDERLTAADRMDLIANQAIPETGG